MISYLYLKNKKGQGFYQSYRVPIILEKSA